MALLIYLKEQGTGALIVKGTIKKYLEALEETKAKKGHIAGQRIWIVCTSWQDKKLAIAEDMISHLAEETDEQINKNIKAQKEQAEERSKAQRGNVIQTPKLMIPGQGQN